MAGILLRDTPVITSYFITYITASSSKVQNYHAEAISHVRLAKTSLAYEHPGRVAEAFSPPPALRPRSDTLTRFLLKRLGLALITLFLLSVIVFAISTCSPGDVGRAVLGPFATQERSTSSTRSSAPTGRSSSSTATGSAASCTATSASPYAQVPAWDLVGPALTNSLKLALVAFLLVVPLAILGGVIAGLRYGSRPTAGSRSAGSRSPRCPSS